MDVPLETRLHDVSIMQKVKVRRAITIYGEIANESSQLGILSRPSTDRNIIQPHSAFSRSRVLPKNHPHLPEQMICPNFCYLGVNKSSKIPILSAVRKMFTFFISFFLSGLVN